MYRRGACSSHGRCGGKGSNLVKCGMLQNLHFVLLIYVLIKLNKLNLVFTLYVLALSGCLLQELVMLPVYRRSHVSSVSLYNTMRRICCNIGCSCTLLYSYVISSHCQCVHFTIKSTGNRLIMMMWSKYPF